MRWRQIQQAEHPFGRPVDLSLHHRQRGKRAAVLTGRQRRRFIAGRSVVMSGCLPLPQSAAVRPGHRTYRHRRTGQSWHRRQPRQNASTSAASTPCCRVRPSAAAAAGIPPLRTCYTRPAHSRFAANQHRAITEAPAVSAKCPTPPRQTRKSAHHRGILQKRRGRIPVERKLQHDPLMLCQQSLLGRDNKPELWRQRRHVAALRDHAQRSDLIGAEAIDAGCLQYWGG